MKIGITGAQSVGKTTLLSALRSEPALQHLDVRTEITRTIKDYGLPINENGTDATQILIMKEHVFNLCMYDNMITDRTVLDGLVYTEYLYAADKVTRETRDLAVAVFERFIGSYSVLFYIKPEFDIVDDGVRSVDLNFRDQIARRFDKTIETYCIPVIELTGSVRSRTNQVLESLNIKG